MTSIQSCWVALCKFCTQLKLLGYDVEYVETLSINGGEYTNSAWIMYVIVWKNITWLYLKAILCYV